MVDASVVWVLRPRETPVATVPQASMVDAVEIRVGSSPFCPGDTPVASAALCGHDGWGRGVGVGLGFLTCCFGIVVCNGDGVFVVVVFLAIVVIVVLDVVVFFLFVSVIVAFFFIILCSAVRSYCTLTI